MAITVIDQPDQVGLARNHLWFTLQTDNHLEATKSLPSFFIGFTDQPNDGDLVWIEWETDDGQIAAQTTLIARTNPSAYYEFEVNGNPVNTWVQNTFLPFLQSHKLINSWFDLGTAFFPDFGVLFVFREHGRLRAHWNVLSNSTFKDNSQTSIVERRKDNFEIGVRTFVHDGDQYHLIDTSHYTPTTGPNNFGHVTFDISDIVLPQLEKELPASSAQLAKGICRKYYIQFYEYFGSPATINNLPEPDSNSDEKYALLAALPYHLFSGNNFISDFIYNQNNFLTWKPYERHVTPDQEEHLYMLYPSSSSLFSLPGDWNVKATIHFTDGNSVEEYLYTFAPNNDWEPNDVFQLPIGFNQNNIADVDQNKTVYKYEVEVIFDYFGAVTTHSVKVTCHIDRLPHQYTRQFFFVNSLGGVDTLMTLGAETKTLSVEGGEGRNIPQKGYASTARQRFEFNKVARKSYTARTGYLSKEEIEWLQDLLINHQYCYTKMDGKDVPVKIDPSDYDLYTETDELISLSFDYELAFDYNAFARSW